MKWRNRPRGIPQPGRGAMRKISAPASGQIFAIHFAVGVVTGIPMEFQFGANWARFSKAASGLVGQTLAMEGMFSFFLESTFLGLFLLAEKKLARNALASAVAVGAGSWLSGFCIIATDAWMRHPVAMARGTKGEIVLASLSGLLKSPWIPWQYLHNMIATVMTGSLEGRGIRKDIRSTRWIASHVPVWACHGTSSPCFLIL